MIYPPVLTGPRVMLQPFDAAQISERYLSWLNNDVVNRYSRRVLMDQMTRAAAIDYVNGLGADEHILGIHLDPYGHVGNLKYGPVDWINLRADISIVIGEQSAWGLGVAGEAITLLSHYLIDELGLNRLYAGSNNPAFLRVVEKLGWRVEGVCRESIKTKNGYRDHTLVALLADEFKSQ